MDTKKKKVIKNSKAKFESVQLELSKSVRFCLIKNFIATNPNYGGL